MSKELDAIAICGMACRFPGNANGPDSFWDLLVSRKDAVTRIPDWRFSGDYYFHPRRGNAIDPGTSYVWSAGVIEGIDRFDAAFFEVSPREAEQMDPQQRLMLELSWEALENAGLPPSRLAGSQCGVFVGVSLNDYASIRYGDGAAANSYYITGGALSLVSNRVSYFLDLHGPSMSIDTACSSSLVGLHLACQALRSGEIPMAIVGGVNALLVPFPFGGFASASMLSPDGKCRSFDAGANGYVRAEGGAALVLKPLSAALANGDVVHAVIRGTAVNSDGRTRGISLPNDRAQETLLEELYGRAGVDPSNVKYLEAHGTGTAAGDPLEMAAIGRFFGPHRRRNDPLLIGSVKTNIGHLEPGAGLAGVLKSVLAMKHRTIPATLHFETPNPHIPFDQYKLKVVTEPTKLAGTRPPVMGVNSFGFGGTNAHVVLEGYEGRRKPSRKKSAQPVTDSTVPPLYLSARSPGALKALAGSYLPVLGLATPEEYYDIAWSAAFHRDLLSERLVIRGDSIDALLMRLEGYLQGSESKGVLAGPSVGRKVKVAWVFPGNGCQWAGMGRDLLDRHPVFTGAVERLDRAFQPLAGWSLIDELRKSAAESRLNSTEIAQPCLMAIQIALIDVLESWGARPDAVLGHSVGEVAAAYAAGIFTIEQAARVIHVRSQCQEKTRGQGRMAAAGLGSEKAEELVRAAGTPIEVACVNSARSVTLSGPLDALEKLGQSLEPDGVFFRLLDLDYAFHHSVMDPIREELLQRLAKLRPGRQKLPMISTVTGGPIEPRALGARYWWDNVRKPVQFGPAVDHLVKEGFNLFVEIGPHPILQTYLREGLAQHKAPGSPLGTLRRDQLGMDQLETLHAQLHVLGDAVDRRRDFPVAGAFRPLPTYPWQRERYWYEPTRESLNVLFRQKEHPLLGYRQSAEATAWECRVDLALQPYLKDHALADEIVFPGAAYVEMALAACQQLGGSARQEVRDLEIRRRLVIDPEQDRVIRFRLTGEDRAFAIESRARLSDETWVEHAVGRIVGEPTVAIPPAVAIPAPADGALLEGARHYELTQRVGLSYGPAFHGLEAAWISGREAWGRLAQELPGVDASGYLVHPAILDAGIQILVELVHLHAGNQEAGYIPVQFGRIVRHAAGSPAFVRAKLERLGPRSMVVTYQLLGATGDVLLEMERCRLQRARLKRDGGEAVPLITVTPRPAQRYDQEYHSPAPSLAHLEAHLTPWLKSEAARIGRSDHHRRALPLATSAVAGFYMKAFSFLGPWVQPRTLEDILSEGGIDPRHRELVRAMLATLQEQHLVQRTDRGWSIPEQAREASPAPGEESLGLSRSPPEPSRDGSPERLWRRLIAEHPSYGREWTLIGRMGLHLGEILRSKLDPGKILAGRSADGVLEPAVDHTPLGELQSGLIVEALGEITARWPANRRIRILEVGARSAHRCLLACASIPPALNHEYVVAPLDAATAPGLAMALGGTPGARVVELDLATSPAAQGLARHSFDVVLIHDALHLVNDLRGTLDRLSSLVAAGGVFLVTERGTDAGQELIHGALPDWWIPGQEPPASRRLPVGAWKDLLLGHGFEDVRALREPGAPGESGATFLMARPRVTPATGAAAAASRPRHLLVEDPSGASEGWAAKLARELEAAGHTVTRTKGASQFRSEEAGVVELDLANPAHWQELFDVEGGLPFPSVVYLCGVQSTTDPSPEVLLDEVQKRLAAVLSLAQGLQARAAGAFPRLTIVTRGPAPSVQSPCPPVSPVASTVWGLVRVLANEMPDLKPRMIDLRGTDPKRLSHRLATELSAADDEDEILLSEDARHVHRFQMKNGVLEGTASEVPEPVELAARNTRLGFSSPGPLDHLGWRTVPRDAVGPHQIEIETRSVGLNFRDVMWAMGLLPDEALEGGFAGPSLGMECSGVVVRTGEKVTRFSVGDEVLGFAPSCFSRYVVTSEGAAMRKPSSLSHAEAATIPSTFFTAYYSLVYLARLEAGEKVLIHGAAGGVGLAAIQIANLIGAEVFATAGSDEKRDFLGLHGVEHILDSRSLAFADQVMEKTRGEGVDVVLNSLASEAMRRSLAVLRPMGRFVELGKRDFYQDTRIGLKPLRNNVSYFGVDADQLMTQRPALAERLFAEMIRLFEAGKLRPLVHRVFPQNRVVDAFRTMQQSSHIGKIVVDMRPLPADPVPARPGARRPLALRPEASYLVTGGLGGLGLAVARWLVEKGARTLILVGRSGAATPEAQQAVKDLEAAGVRVEVVAADIALAQQVQAAVTAGGRGSPLAGVIHTAAVLRDSVVGKLTPESVREVLAPKVLGARHLHEATRELDLDFFVMFSSASALFGNPGQANYVAANMYLEALADRRRREGLPALTIQWGAVTDVGMLAKNERAREHLKSRVGDRGLTSHEVVEIMGRLIEEDLGIACATRVDWGQLRKFLPSLTRPKYEEIVRGLPEGEETGESPQELRRRLGELPAEDRVEALVDLLRRRISHIMRWAMERIDRDKPVVELGFDSLMAVELQMALEKDLGVSLPGGLIGQTTSIADLASSISTRIATSSAEASSRAD